MKGDLKMKVKSIFAVSLLAAGVAFADTTEVETSYVVGVFPLSVSAGENIINVPWVESGTTGAGVAVTNLVKTANLTKGDSLLWYNTGSQNFYGWHVVSNVVSGTQYWEPTTSITSYGEKVFLSSSTTALSKGDAIILKVANAGTAYIVGQYDAGKGSGVAVTAGTSTNPTYTLFAPPGVDTGCAINGGLEFTGTVDDKDMIWLADGTEVRKGKNGTWLGIKDGNVLTPITNPTIPCGQGAWYVSKGGSPTITFK